MIILKPIWEYDEGKYARVDGMKIWWWTSNILPVSWECDINNYIGRSSVPISMNILNKYYFENICDLPQTHSVKSKESGVNVSRKSHGIKVSPVSDVSSTKSENMEMDETWGQV